MLQLAAVEGGIEAAGFRNCQGVKMTLSVLTPCECIGNPWRSDPHGFIGDPIHQMR